MEDPIVEEENDQEAKRKAKEFYERIGRVWCPVLGENVVFCKIGFQHIVRKGQKRRPISDQKRRFSLLVHVKDILENPNVEAVSREGETVQSVKRHGQKVTTTSAAKFGAIREKRANIQITVVIRQSGRKEKNFFSVYDKKLKNQKTVE